MTQKEQIHKVLSNKLCPPTRIEKIIYDTIDNVKILNELKYFCFPMRTGKTHTTLEKVVPYIFANTNCNLIILTAPLLDIIEENKKKLRTMQKKGNFIYVADHKDAEDHLKDGENVVLYESNANSRQKSTFNAFLDRIDLSIVSVIVDEADYGTVSGKENLPNTKGYSSKDFKASMYTMVSKIANKSPV